MTLIAVPAVGIMAARGKRRTALNLLRGWGVCISLYLATLMAVSIATPVRVLRVGDAQCSDDWCITVATVRRPAEGTGRPYEIDFELSSRARGVWQREKGLIAYLVGERGTRFDPLPDPRQLPFEVLLSPGQKLTAMRRFQVPEHAGRLNLVVTREGIQMGWLIIGRSPFDRKTVVRID